MTIAEFIAEHRITATCERIPVRTDLDFDNEWSRTAHHWLVTLKRPQIVLPVGAGARALDVEFKVAYSTGSGVVERVPFEKVPPFRRMGVSRAEWEAIPRPGSRGLTINAAEFQKLAWRAKEPTAHDVMESLIQDAQSIHNSVGFEDWASDMGVDTDSRKGERMYEATKLQARRFLSFLGPLAGAALELESE